jgi:hypothetical protein
VLSIGTVTRQGVGHAQARPREVEALVLVLTHLWAGVASLVAHQFNKEARNIFAV